MTTTPSRLLTWFGYNALAAVLLYYALVEDVVTAQYIIQGFVIAVFAFSIMIFNPAGVAILAKSKVKIASAPLRAIDVFVDSLILLLFSWAGWMWVGGMYLFHVISVQIMMHEALKYNSVEDTQ